MRSSKRPRNRLPEPARATPPSHITLEHKQFWSGPLPPPDALEEFRRVVPDAPERIIAQWELEAGHRRAYEARGLELNATLNKRGQWAAITFALAALSLAAFAIYMGQPVVAGVVGSGTIAAVVGAFLYQRKGAKD